MAVELRGALAIFCAAAGGEAAGYAARQPALAAVADGHAGRRAQALALAVLALEVLCGEQVDLIVGLQRDVVARRQRAAAVAGAGRGLGLLAFRMAGRQTDIDAQAVFRQVGRGVFRRQGGGGRCHRRDPAALRLARCLAHRLHGLDRIDHTAAHGQREAVLRHLADELAVNLVLARGDRHARASQVDVLSGHQVAAGHVDGAAGVQGQAAGGRTDQAARLPALQARVLLLVGTGGVRPVADAEPAPAQEPAFLDGARMILFAGIDGCRDRDGVLGRQVYGGIARDPRSRHLDVVTGNQVHRSAAPGCCRARCCGRACRAW
ncbi:MAG: hypothetical protein JWQ61_898 [Collimonas fungivorans]|nr:hypothetical protein [Collimonas fungivorans]